MQIVKMKLKNFKGITGEQELTGKDLFVGLNGAGKTARLKAVTVALLGHDPAISNQPRDVMQHIAGDEGGVSILIKDKNNVTEISRMFRRNEKGEIKADIKVIPKKGEKNARDYNARIQKEFGQFSIMFNLLEFYNMTETEMRNFFFDKCKATGFDKETVFKLLNKVLLGKTGELRKEMKSLIDYYDKEWDDELTIKDNVGKLLDDLKLKHNHARSKLNSFLDVEDEVNDKKTEDDTGQRIKTIRGEIARHEEEIKKAQTTIDKEDANRTAYDNKSEEISEVAKEIAEYKEGFGEGVNYQSQIEDNERTMKDIQSIIDKADANRKAYNDIMDQVGTVKSLMETFKSETPDLDRDYELLIKQSEETKKEIEEAVVNHKAMVKYADACPLGIDCEKLKKQNKEKEFHKEQHEIMSNELEKETYVLNGWHKCAKNKEHYLEEKEQLVALEERLKKYNIPSDVSESKLDIKAKEQKIEVLREGLLAQEKYTAAVERLAKSQEQLKKYDAPSDVSALKDIVSAHSQDLMKAREGLEIKLKSQEAERLLADVKLERTKYEVVLDAVKELGEVAGKNGIYGEIIKSILDPFAEVINGLLAKIDKKKQLAFELEDPITGKACFRFGWDKPKGIIPFKALSTGEQAVYSVAIMVALIKQNDPPLKALMIDNIEAIDRDHRGTLIDACCKFKDEGEIDNVILAGCIAGGEEGNRGAKEWEL